MQVYRDNADYIFTASENEATRAYNTAVAAMQAQAQGGGMSAMSSELIRAGSNVLGSVLASMVKSEGGRGALLETGKSIFSFLNPFD